MTANLEALGASLMAVIREIAKAQSSANTTIDRGGEAIRLLGMVSDGSSNELLSNALANLSTANDDIETAIGKHIMAVELVADYARARGLTVEKH